jgi:hypothetical protein
MVFTDEVTQFAKVATIGKLLKKIFNVGGISENII